MVGLTYGVICTVELSSLDQKNLYEQVRDKKLTLTFIINLPIYSKTK